LFGAELNCAHDLSCIRRVVLGGEPARGADFDLFKARFARGTVFVNGVGLTEATVGLQFAADHDTRLSGQVVPVGRAAAGVEVELLDTEGRPSWIGEITLTGAGVAQGYWRQSELIRQRFVTVGTVRRYRTGDVGRRLPDGQIAWVGRMDDQVKIRGYRVEPGEIEAALTEHAEVAECAILADCELPGETRLVAYVVIGGVTGAATPGVSGGREALAAGLRAHLSDRLPAYMVPQAFEVLAALPRLPNGKIDRLQLPRPGWGRDAAQALVPARTELEAVLAAVWQDVLGLDRVGVHDDFFALGGHSLLATRLVSRIRDRLELEVPLFSVFEYPTVAGLAEALEHDALTVGNVLPSLGRRGRDPSQGQAV
jgi:acyl-CoA synthetase (AMP-forming)/AMP-acid ligase II/acyl carrier protein